ncbi:exopolysaccharide biosynthesis protein [Kineobactrum salinum]|nr:exopolysaccharide biosynthesis protein [Kineobactrum salinum]
MLDRTADGQQQKVCIGEIIAAVGSRSFAPLLMLIGVLIASPLSGVPGFPTLGAIIVALVSGQMLVGRKHFWLPHWLLARSVPRQRMSEVIRWLRPSARFVDKLLKPRLAVMVNGPGRYMIALTCLLIAGAMPFLELIPFSSSAAGATLSAFGLALVSHDGALAALAYLVTGLTAWLLIAGLF